MEVMETGVVIGVFASLSLLASYLNSHPPSTQHNELNNKTIENELNSEKQLLLACQNGNIEQVKELINNNQDIDVNTQDKFSEDWTPLMHACWFQHFEIVGLLLNDKRININLGNKLGQTAFHFSFQNGETKILELMMKNKNLDIQKADNNGCTPLMRACSYGHLEVVKILMNSEKRPDLNLENSHGQSAFYLACRNGNTELVKLLLENEDLNINTIDNFGRSPLMMACSSGKLKNVELILGFKSEIDINLMDKDRKTALDFATIVWVKSSRESQEQFVNKQMEYSKIIELLESFGNSPNATRDYLRKRTVHLEASNLCSLIVLLSDGYYNLKE